MVLLVRAAYHGDNSTILVMVLGPHVMAPLLLMGGLLWASQERRSTFLTATVIAGSGFLLAGLWQHKGFTYHFIPALGCGFIGLGLIAVDLRTARAQPACACSRRWCWWKSPYGAKAAGETVSLLQRPPICRAGPPF
jgi:uncharacterized membrane protein (UPF0136 family)